MEITLCIWWRKVEFTLAKFEHPTCWGKKTDSPNTIAANTIDAVIFPPTIMMLSAIRDPWNINSWMSPGKHTRQWNLWKGNREHEFSYPRRESCLSQSHISVTSCLPVRASCLTKTSKSRCVAFQWTEWTIFFSVRNFCTHPYPKRSEYLPSSITFRK